MRTATDDTQTWAAPVEGVSAEGFSLLVQDRRGLQLEALPAGRPLVLGRDASAELVVEAEGVSRRHVSFRVVDGLVEVVDLDSRNGTFVTGQRVSRLSVSVGAEVRLGAAVALVVRGTAISGADLLASDAFRSRLATLVAGPVRTDEAIGVLHLRFDAGSSATSFVSWLRDRVGPGGAACLYTPTVVEVVTPPMRLQALRALATALASERPGVTGGWVCWPEAGTSADALLALARDAGRLSSRAGQLVGYDELKAESTMRGPGPMVVRSQQMQALQQEIEQVARSQVPVLVLGESGTGKELVARELHLRSARAAGPFKAVNCAALPASLLESLLFGHEKGAFTGADRVSKGLFEEADGGTVFLDEVGELPPSAQAALLRVVEARHVTRVGSTQERPVDVRLVAATHRDLEAMAAEGAFRHDLLFRLNALTLRLAPLRERLDDVPPLVERFLAEACAQHDGVKRVVTPATMDVLLRYHWPGNVRELKNVVTRAVILSRTTEIGPELLDARVRSQRTPGTAAEPSVGAAHRERLVDYERAMLLDVLEKCGWNQSAAARKLGMPRRTLVYKIRHLGLRKSS
ncbi:MAG: sigma 54-interacting transcriptional regulator [Myxococcaceae bacterium]|nr:sigma 54-interacting transcriptional regulator [Myxococcaceae bacterium]